MHGTELLAAPRGRALCANLLQVSGLFAPRRGTVAEAEIQRAADGFRVDGGMAERIFEALRLTVDTARYWQEPFDDDAELTRLGKHLRPVADAISSHVATAWWESPMASEQFAVILRHDGEDDLPLVLAGTRSALERSRAGEVARAASMRETLENGEFPWERMSSKWWTTPGTENPATTRAWPERGPVGLYLVEDRAFCPRAIVYPVAPARRPRIYEVSDAAAWRELVSRYPFDVTEVRGPDWYRALGRRGGWLIPDWLAVAEDYDAVHVSIIGYLTASGATIELDPEFATTLAGWSPDETYWLTDILMTTGEPTTWYTTDQESWDTQPSRR